MGLARVNEIQQTNEGILGITLSKEPEAILFFITRLFITERLIRFN